MPLEDIAGKALVSVFRVVVQVLLEVFAEVLFRRTGFYVLRFFRIRVEIEDAICVVTGLILWLLFLCGFLYWFLLRGS